MVTPKFKGTVRKGKFVPDDPKGYFLYCCRHEGKEVTVVLKQWRNVRSSKQNNYYWGVVIEILRDHFGYTNEEMHEALKYKFLKKVETGKPITVQSTASLNTDQFCKYIDNIVSWATMEHGVYIPDPDSVEF